jgi:DNA polymerase III subunit delta'
MMEPPENPEFIDESAAERALLESACSGRLAHAWLLTGPRGVGKATLAYRFARFLLAGGDQGPARLFGDPPANLYLDPGHPTFRRVASASHSDLRCLVRSINPDTGKLRGEIIVEDLRKAVASLRLTPSDGGWRVVIVDGAEEMNRNAQNALLKVLEEPPASAVLLLVSHAPGRLLPTIRSRCRRLELRPLSSASVAQLIGKHMPDLPEADRRLAARLAEGSVGQALSILDAGGIELYLDLGGLLSKLPAIDSVALHRQADRLSRSGEEEAYRMAVDLLLGWLARMIRICAGGYGGELVAGEHETMLRLVQASRLTRWIELFELLRDQFALVESVNLDRRQVWVSSLLRIQRLAAA